MTSDIITVTLFILWAAGVSESVLITQWPHYISISPNSPVEMHCYQNDTDHQYMYWYKQQKGKGLELIVSLVGGSVKFENEFESGYQAQTVEVKKSSLTISSVQGKDEAVYLCAAKTGPGEPAYFGQGTKLTVLEKEPIAPKVKILKPSPKECRNSKDKKRKKTLVCVAYDFYPDHVTVSWKINGKTTNNGVATDNYAKQDKDTKNYRITSRLRVLAEDWEKDTNEFKCIVSFYNKTEKKEYEDKVLGIQVETKTLTREKFLRGSQNGKLCYGVFIVKSCIYGAFVTFLVWKLQSSAGKQKY